jgi:hypothetical protein
MPYNTKSRTVLGAIAARPTGDMPVLSASEQLGGTKGIDLNFRQAIRNDCLAALIMLGKDT